MFSPSGGGLYHWRAITRRGLWQPFTAALELWLEAWPIPKTELLLIGPSGGHTLPSHWLAKFTKITAFDIDPLAAPLFHLRHRRVKVQFEKRDVFFKNGKLNLETLHDLRSRHPLAAILFCNILGQLPLENRCTDEEWLGFLSALPGALGRSPWASYHDAYTFEGLPRSLHKSVADAFLSDGSIDEMTAKLGENSAVIYDHMTTGNWAIDSVKTRLAWSLTPKSLHLLEAAFCNPAGGSTHERETDPIARRLTMAH